MRFFTISLCLDHKFSLKLHTMIPYDNAETSKKNLWPNLGPKRPESGLKWDFPAFSFFIKRGKILLNWYFTSVDYIEFLSPVTPLLPSLGIAWGPCYSRNLEIFYILMFSGVQSNLLVHLESRKRRADKGESTKKRRKGKKELVVF